MGACTIVSRLLEATRRHIGHGVPGIENIPVYCHHTAFGRRWSARVFQLRAEYNTHAALPFSAICTS